MYFARILAVRFFSFQSVANRSLRCIFCFLFLSLKNFGLECGHFFFFSLSNTRFWQKCNNIYDARARYSRYTFGNVTRHANDIIIYLQSRIVVLLFDAIRIVRFVFLAPPSSPVFEFRHPNPGRSFVFRSCAFNALRPVVGVLPLKKSQACHLKRKKKIKISHAYENRF